MPADLGSKAPDFTLPNQDRQPVLDFFPAAFSSTRTKETCSFRDSIAELNRSSARVLDISVDTWKFLTTRETNLTMVQ
jgi:peroxiredoxin